MMNDLKNIRFFKYVIILIVGIMMSFSSYAQESVTDLFKNDLKVADQDFIDQDYQSALNGYLRVVERKNVPSTLPLKIARCFYFTKKYEKSVNAYQQIAEKGKQLNSNDLFYFAESLAITGNYDEAISYYEKCLSLDPENEILIKKIWRLSNRNYLFEDSVYYTVREVPINTLAGELSAVPYKNGVVFTSNREEAKWVKKVDASTNSPFYQLYFASVFKDPLGIGPVQYGTVAPFNNVFQSDFHTGPLSFYEGGKKMVFVKSGEKKVSGKARTLQLYFAEKKKGAWEITESFPYNSINYTNTDPTINHKGDLLYFASDQQGGMGGMDLYVSHLSDSGWSTPENLGPEINTVGDEVFPYLHSDGTLFFSSDGHAGLGGLDIFKAIKLNNEFNEVENMGYPLNSGYDDLGIYIDSTNNSGYLSSNRKNGGYDDDIYEFEMDLQPYPMTVTGVLKFIEHNWMDSSELKALPDVTLYLVDDVKDIVVAETVSDSEGNFKMIVPYFSKYKVRVVGEGIDGIVSFEVPKHKKINDTYDIVIVNDDFKTVSN